MSGQQDKDAVELACGLNLSPEERKSVIDALLQEIDRTQKWTRLVVEMQAEIASLRLTQEERSAIADAADRYAEITPESAATAATLRGLLERTK